MSVWLLTKIKLECLWFSENSGRKFTCVQVLNLKSVVTLGYANDENFKNTQRFGFFKHIVVWFVSQFYY